MRLKGLVTLKKAKEFAYVRCEGRSASSGGLLLQAAGDPCVSSNCGLIRVGFTVSRKSGNAVTRNRIKRVLRVVAQDVIVSNANRGFCYVLVSSRRLSRVGPFLLRSSLLLCLKKLGLHSVASDGK